jgi:hypothetical protein
MISEEFFFYFNLTFCFSLNEKINFFFIQKKEMNAIVVKIMAHMGKQILDLVIKHVHQTYWKSVEEKTRLVFGR